MSEARFEQYNEVINNLVGESIGCSPMSWNAGTLTIDCDGTAIHYKLKNHEDENKASLSDELRGLCEQLYVLMRDNGDVWNAATINYFKKEDTWGFKVDFEYAPSENENS